MTPRTVTSTTYRGIGAGFFIAIAGAAALNLSATVASPSVSLLIRSAVFSVGLIFIMLTRQLLFTGAAVSLSENTTNKFYFSSLGIIWMANLVGVGATTLILTNTMSSEAVSLCCRIAEAKCATPFFDLVLYAIPCNILIGLAVQLSTKTKVNTITAAFLAVFTFMANGFEHSIASMFYLLCARVSGAAITLDKFLLVLLATTIGNFIGAIISVVAWED